MYELKEKPISIEALKESIVDIEDDNNNKSHKMWRRSKTNDSFPFTYHPDLTKATKRVRGFTSAASARLGKHYYYRYYYYHHNIYHQSMG